eukprot:1189938-Prorocentrum_minimum.AAC.2
MDLMRPSFQGRRDGRLVAESVMCGGENTGVLSASLPILAQEDPYEPTLVTDRWSEEVVRATAASAASPVEVAVFPDCPTVSARLARGECARARDWCATRSRNP